MPGIPRVFRVSQVLAATYEQRAAARLGGGSCLLSPVSCLGAPDVLPASTSAARSA